YASEPLQNRIVSYGAGGDEKVVVQGVQAHHLAITQKGAIYFTDEKSKSVGMVDAAGHARVVYGGGEIVEPAGIALSPDQAMVIVTDAQSRFEWSFQIGADGMLENGEPFYRVVVPEMGSKSEAKGVAMDAEGAAYFATPGMIQVCEASGRGIEILNAPEAGRGLPLPEGGRRGSTLWRG